MPSPPVLSDRLDRRDFLKAVGIASAGALLPGTGRAARKVKPPNILFIMSDQHNVRAMGCSGNKEVHTPSLDRLASEGTRFENAFTHTGQCCPARYTIWTGRYRHSHGLLWNGVAENLAERTVGEVFKEAGYATASIGKHHMKRDVRRHGFDHIVDRPQYHQFIQREGVGHCYAEGDWLPEEINSRIYGPIGPCHADNAHHMAGFWTDSAIDYLREERDEPFCLWLSYYGPHPPFIASKEFADLYDPESLSLPPNNPCQLEKPPAQLAHMQKMMKNATPDQMRRILHYYYAYISQIDHNIGRVLDALDRLGLAENTLVVYTADHGEMAGEQGCFRKANMNYDATIRVPMMVRLPGVVPKGKVVKELVGHVDLLPTLCDVADQPCPGKSPGRSLLPLVRGEQTEWRDVIFSEIGYTEEHIGLCTTAHTGAAKYSYHTNLHGDGPMEEFFDIRNDPWETNNEINNPVHASEIERLKKAIADWHATTDRAEIAPIEGFSPADACHPQYRDTDRPAAKNT